MKKRTITKGILSIIIAPLFVACVGSPKTPMTNEFVYDGYNFGANRDMSYKAGVIDGCKTASGDYSKNHEKFKDNVDYHDGWEHGRLKCKGSSK